MRIGILTYWDSEDNYGQLLQCWALQQKLIQLGHEPFLIKYDRFASSHIQEKRKSPFLKKVIKICLIYPVIKKIRERKKSIEWSRRMEILTLNNQKRLFKSFRDTHILQTDITYNSLEGLQSNPPKADVYIVGSDQVWANLPDRKENEVFYLHFGNNEIVRVSFAASFGRSVYPDNLKESLSNQLKRFHAISVREKSGVDICSSVGCMATHVLDPTLLLKSSDYEFLCQTKEFNNHYIYVYSLNITKPEDIFWTTIKEYAKVHQLDTIVTPSSGYVPGLELFDNTRYEYATVERWISRICHADLIITTSFHGTVFAIIHHIPFVAIKLKGVFEDGNNRISELLQELSLSYRFVENAIQLQEAISLPIDWMQVDLCLDKLRLQSIEFLKKVLTSSL